MGTNANDDERKGRLNNGERACDAVSSAHIVERDRNTSSMSDDKRRSQK